MGARRSAVFLVTAGLLSIGAAPAANAAVLLVGGTSGSLGQLLPQDAFGSPQDVLAGAYHGQEVIVVDYPGSLWPLTGPRDLPFGESVAVGTRNTSSAIRANAEVTEIVGISQGAIVAQNTAETLNGDTSIPGDTTFVLIANPNSGLFKANYGSRIPIFDYTPSPLPETRFNFVVVVNEYDAWADPLTQPWNLLSVANAVMAMIYVHPFAQGTDLSTVPPENIVRTVNSQGGTQTTYLVPTEQLPLTKPLRQVGVPTAIVDELDTALRPLIDAGYDRGARQLSPPTTALSAGMELEASTRMRGVGSDKSADSPTNGPQAVGSATARAQPRDSSSRPAATGTSGRR